MASARAGQRFGLPKDSPRLIVKAFDLSGRVSDIGVPYIHSAMHAVAFQKSPFRSGSAKSTMRAFIIAGKAVGLPLENSPPPPTGSSSVSLEKISKLPKAEDELTSMDVFRAVQAAGAFDFWDDPREDIYSIKDGEPI